jgi:hypothetical protein
MIAGLPGTGISGVFYILLALWMPVRELWRAANGRRDPEKQRIMRTQGVLTLFMLPAILAAGWAAGWLFWALVPHAISAGDGAVSAGSSGAARNVLRLWPVVLTLATLVFVYLALRAVQVVLRGRALRSRRTPQAPVGLSERSTALWRAVVTARVRSLPRLTLIEQALRALDRADQARRRLEEEGPPLYAEKEETDHRSRLVHVERESRELFVSLWTGMQLGRDAEPPRGDKI